MNAPLTHARLSEIRADMRTILYISDGTSGSDKVARLLSAVPDLLAEVDRLTAALDAALAEARAGALEEAKAIVTRVCRDDLEDYYGQIRVEVGRALDDRAAEIREAQK